MISVGEATRRIAGAVLCGKTETVPTLEAGGRVLRHPVTAERAFPPFDRVMMDGVGVSRQAWQSGARSFRLSGLAAAGQVRQSLADPRAAIEVMTGAVVPEAVDLVIPLERLRRHEDQVDIETDYTPPPGGFIHPMGSDAQSGSELLKSGTRLDARAIAVAISCGACELTVSVQPKIAVVSNGDELVEPGAPIEPHQVRRSNVHALRTALLEYGVPEISLHHFRDSRDALREGLKVILTEHDFVLLSGGVSQGKRDLIPEVLKALQAEIIFHRVAQRPGKPMLFAKRGQTLIFGLPGNPVSTLIGLYRHVLPALDRWSGATPKALPLFSLSEPVSSAPPLTLFLPVAQSGIGSVAPRPVANSGDFATLLDSDGFIELPAELGNFAPGFSAPFYQWS